MKIISALALSGIMVLATGKLTAQKSIKDTAAYLKKFETNREKYIGKPFSLLLKDMALLQIRKAKSEISEDAANTLLTTRFLFSDQNIDSSQPALVIRWKADDAPVTPIEFLEQDHQYRFTVSERNFFEKKVIRDLMVKQ
ncbi:hypothetical protein [uncultured Chryseobacterium sp.]|uniref:hypothetical protein n=1 Tax=uncultured Chryseobacterium sp. TaxID=259322 RepID=UPI0025D35EB2|nr:hypothetical protein [uncultured Chryseobacterium sp.]